jgi:hypothetical protein
MQQTRTATQTATQAKRLASRIGAELLQLQSAYGKPSDTKLAAFVEEAEMYLAAGYLNRVSYGWKRDGEVIFELTYVARGATLVNDKPGRVPPTADLSGANWFSYLWKSAAWWNDLSSADRERFEAKSPVKRETAPAPIAAAGLRLVGNKTFSEDTLGLSAEVRTL